MEEMLYVLMTLKSHMPMVHLGVLDYLKLLMLRDIFILLPIHCLIYLTLKGYFVKDHIIFLS